jgi:hypothetical protein
LAVEKTTISLLTMLCSKVVRKLIPLSLLLFLSSCHNQGSRNLTISSEEISPLLLAAGKFPRKSFGFSPLPTNPESPVFLEIKRHNGSYLWVLTIPGNTEKTIAFEKKSDKRSYRWVHEKEKFYGPGYFSPDGSWTGESICLIYETKKISAPSPDRLHVLYEGVSPSLSGSSELELSDVKTILSLWRSLSRTTPSPKESRASASSFLK